MLGEQLHNCNPVKYEYASCLPPKDGGVPLSALPKDTTINLAGLLSTLSFFYAKRKEEKLGSFGCAICVVSGIAAMASPK